VHGKGIVAGVLEVKLTVANGSQPGALRQWQLQERGHARRHNAKASALSRSTHYVKTPSGDYEADTRTIRTMQMIACVSSHPKPSTQHGS
jgi:hypothetical protein